MSLRECIKRIYAKSGVRGFYKGITASYFGISETVIHFVIYEALKAKLVSFINFIQYFQLNVIIFIFPFSSSRFGILPTLSTIICHLRPDSRRTQLYESTFRWFNGLTKRMKSD